MSTRAMFRVPLFAALSVLILAMGAFAQTQMTMEYATVPVKVNAAAKVVLAPITGVVGTGEDGNVVANTPKDFNIMISTGYVPIEGEGSTGVLPGQALGAWVSYSHGNLSLNLPQQYQNAVISLYSLNGKQVFRANANQGKFSISASRIPVGIYVLSVKGKGGFFTTKLTSSGGKLSINSVFSNESGPKLKKAGDLGRWTITVSADGHRTEIRTIRPSEGMNDVETFTLTQPVKPDKKSFTETVDKVSFDMIYIPGGTFTIGCTASRDCPLDTKAVEGVRVSNYFIGKTEVTIEQWNAVIGGASCNQYYPRCTDPYGSMTWYDAMEFACKLGQLTGKNYRMTTEAEWEYAAKNRSTNGMSDIGGGSGMGGEEWAYNSWSSTHSGGTDPVGPGSGLYTQKTRRDPNGTADNITGRLIRSVEGVGPALRLAISADSDYPPGYVSPCNLHMPEVGPEPTNSHRDPRWVTGSYARWTTAGGTAIGSFDLRVWEDGTAKLGSTNGQWFTSNNIAFVFVPSSSSRTPTKYAYIFLDDSQGSLISDKGYADYRDPGFIGRIVKEKASNVAKPEISGLKKGSELAAEAGPDYKMWDMTNIPQEAKQQDPRLLDGPNHGWFQDNRQAGGVHHYRKDVDADEFRFTVNQRPSSSTMLANGSWFTVNNTFLRITHKDGYVAEYLYAVDSEGTFYHNSFMAYERGDFRMFKKTANAPENSDLWSTTCGDLCSGEIDKGQGASMYSRQGETGLSTFVPAPCPSGGCQ